MRRFLPAFPLLLIAVLGGCRTPGETRPGLDSSSAGGGGGRPSVEPPETDPLKPGHWLHTSGGSGVGPGVPPGDLLGGRDDVRSEVKGLLAGYVVGPGNRKVRKATIQVEPVNSPGEGAIDYETQTDGSFMIAGLTTGKSYRLTVKHNDEGVVSGGQVLAKVPNVYVRINLIEGLDLTPAKPGKKAEPPPKPPETKAKVDEDLTDKPKGRELPKPQPPNFLDPIGPLPPPGGASSHLPTPQPLIRDTTLNPIRRTDLPADDWSPTRYDPANRAPRPPARPDLNTKRPDDGFRPPVVDLPPPLKAPRQESRRPSGDEFYLIDANGKEQRFPSGRPGELLLVEFMTTTCVPCQKALPTVTAIQARYGDQGLSVIGVTCDDEPLRTRIIYADKYRADHAVNFPILTEPGKSPGTVMKKFGVRQYPSAVLLDHTGGVLWQGHPGDARAVVTAIERHLPAK
jgi:thiol-disulfide isomerase/thioredoxin